jgi:hypothetical protein
MAGRKLDRRHSGQKPGIVPAPTRQKQQGLALNASHRLASSDGSPHAPGRRDGEAPRRRGPVGGLLFLAAFGLLLVAYVFSNPPGAASDEPSHLVKAAALSVGDMWGAPVGYERVGTWSPDKVAWIGRTSRILHVPRDYAGCDGFTVPLDGRCAGGRAVLDRRLPPGTSVSYVATYPVPAYLPAALGIRLASALGGSATAGLLLARAAGAVAAAALATGAVRLLRRGDRDDLPALAGASLTLTPMLVFTCSQVSGSGLELCSGLCFGAGLLRLARPATEDLSARTVWAWTGLSGVVLATARTLGPLWLLVVAGMVLVLRRGRLLGAVRTAPRAAATAIGCLLAGVAMSLAWQAAVEPHPQTSPAIAIANVPAAIRGLLGVADMYVGRFGWIQIRLPLLIVVGWLLLVAGLVAVAGRLGTRRERTALAGSVAVACGATVFVAAYAVLPTAPDFVMQARYVMPALSMVPLLAIDVLRSHASEARRRWGPRWDGLSAAVLASVIVAQSAAFGTNVAAQRAAWRPPLGWGVWECVVGIAALLGLGATARVLRHGRAPSPAGARSPVLPQVVKGVQQ